MTTGGVNNNFIFDTNKLIAMVPNLKLSQKFLLDRFFPTEVVSDTEFVSIDVDVGKRRMAPFVSPLVEGKLVESRRYQTNLFKPAYIKDLRAPDLRKPIRRAIGEQIAGRLTAQERAMANLQFEMEDQVDILNRRLEWMAAQVLLNGSVLVEGEGFDPVLVDFGRDPSLTVTLTGGAEWGATLDANGKDSAPVTDIEAWQHLILKKSGGGCTDIVFTTTPWLKFLNSNFAQGAIQFPKLASSGNDINPGAQIQRGAVYKGSWGQYRLWVYNDWYVDATNTEQMMIPDGYIVMCGPDMMGTRAFGQILDEDFNFASLPYAPKTWTEKNPSQRLLLMQSSPLTIPARVNACLAAQVCAGTVT